MRIEQVSFCSRNRRHHSNQNIQNEKPTNENTNSHSGTTAKILIASMLVLVPIVKTTILHRNPETSEDAQITETTTKKSNNIIEYAVNKVVEKKSDEKLQDDKKLESKLISTLKPIINGVGSKLFSSAKLRGKIEDKLLGETVVEKLDEFLYSKDAKIKTRKILQDKEIQEALMQSLVNKHPNRNIKYLMENHDMQDAIISILRDPNILIMLEKIGKENRIPTSIIETVKDIMGNSSLIRLILNNSYFQEMLAEYLKNPDGGFKFKASKAELAAKSLAESNVIKYNNFINATMHDSFISTTADSFKTYGTVGATVGEGIGNIVGFYIPIVGKPILGTTGQVTGGLIGTIYAPIRNSVNEFLKLFCNDKPDNTNIVDIIEIKKN